MKKILIVNNNMHIGGVQKALVSLLWEIREQYDITLLLFYPGGEYRQVLPPEIKVISPTSGYRYLGMTRQDTVKWQDKLLRTFYAGISRLLGRKYAIFLMGLGQKKLGSFDAAISYLHNSIDKIFYGGCNEFVLKHTQAKKKIAFLHCDYSQCGANTPQNAKHYTQFDTIAACSEGCADTFIRENPHLTGKVKVVRNCHDFQKIRELSQTAPVQLQPDKINIVTVARLAKEKGVARALRVIAKLDALKEKMHYYIIGDGVQLPEIRKIIEQEKLSACVTLCGALENPYGHMEKADLLWIPSEGEAAPLVVDEAAFLGTPILSTETSSARDMIEKTGYGWVCENSEEAMEQQLCILLKDPDLLQRKKQQLVCREFSNQQATAQFLELLADKQ